MTEEQMIQIAKEQFANPIPSGPEATALKLLIYMKYAETVLHMHKDAEIEQYVDDCIGKNAHDEDRFYIWYFNRYCAPPSKP